MNRDDNEIPRSWKLNFDNHWRCLNKIMINTESRIQKALLLHLKNCSQYNGAIQENNSILS